MSPVRPVREPGPEWINKRVNPLVGVKRTRVSGSPNMALATTSHIERFFLTVRQGNKRCARKTLAYSKKWDNHALTASIQIFLYNMVRVHETLKKTPAVALGVADRRWTLEDVVAMTDTFHKAKEVAAFEKAFSKFASHPVAHVPPPIKFAPRTQWRLNPQPS